MTITIIDVCWYLGPQSFWAWGAFLSPGMLWSCSRFNALGMYSGLDGLTCGDALAGLVAVGVNDVAVWWVSAVVVTALVER